MPNPTNAIEIWTDPRDAASLRQRLNAALGADSWRDATPEDALFGIFSQPDPPTDIDPFMPLIALHAETTISSTGAWLQHLVDPSHETLADAVETLAALREIEVFDRAIFEALRHHSNDAIYLLDDHGYFVFVNRMFEELMGLSFEEVCSPDFEFARLVAPLGLPVIAAREEAHRLGKENPPQYEFEAADSGGRYFPVEVSTARIVFRGRIATLGILRDISEQKQAHRALERQNRELGILNEVATVVNQGVELDAVLDRTLQLLADRLHFDAYMATRAEARDGLYSVVAQRGLPQSMCADIAKQEAYDVPRQARVSEKSIVFPDLREADGEAVLIHPDIPRYFRLKLLVPIFHGDTAMGTLQAYSRDPGDYDSRDAELIERVANQLGPAMYRNWLHEEQERQIRHLRSLDSLATSIAEFAATEDLLTRVADTAHEIADCDASTLWWVNENGDLEPRFQRGDAEAVNLSERALSSVHHGPSWLDADGRLIVAVRHAGELLGAMAFRWHRVTLELTARVESLELLSSHAALAHNHARLQDERDQALRRRFESEKLEGLGRMAAGVAHDFNNILAAILGRAQLLKRQVDNNDHMEALRVIEQAALDGAGTVRRIQEFSRQTPEYIEDDALADLEEVVRDTVAQTSSNWSQRSGGEVQLDLDFAEGLVVRADARELREVLTNLIHNALDAMSDGGKLRLATGREESYGLLICGDDGSGIPDEVKERIFDPFFTTKGARGTGLGLAVSFGIVQRSGGTFDVQSVAGVGTVFTLRFPIAKDGAVVVKASSSPPEPTTESRGGRVVVAEDDEMVRELLVHILRDGGYEVRAAENGAIALGMIAENPPDLVLSDLGMPELDGWGLAQAMRRDHPGVPLGFITGWGATLDMDEAREAGASLVLAKPFRYEEVLKQVAKVLSS
jgi:PAS domain S-box-containing protein